MSVTKIIEIPYTIYKGLCKRRLRKEYVGKKVDNASGFNLLRNFEFACTSSLSPRVITWIEPSIQSKRQYLAGGHLKKNRDLLTWPRDMVTWYWSVDTLFWQLSINHNMDVQYQWCTYGNGATCTLLVFKVWDLAYDRTTKIFQTDGLPNFLRYGSPLARLWRAGTPLLHTTFSSCATHKKQWLCVDQ